MLMELFIYLISIMKYNYEKKMINSKIWVYI